MKKFFFVLTVVLFVAALAMAQPSFTPTPTPPVVQTPAVPTPASTFTTLPNNIGVTETNPGLNGQGAGTNWSAKTNATSGTWTGNVIGVLNYIPNYDVMGAHENGGRGCAGCHAPHNQARGNGGDASKAYGAYADAQGGLWGQDTTAILSNYSAGITFNAGNSHHSGVLTWGAKKGGAALTTATAWGDETYLGVATCLSCHDGNVSTGAMMSGVSYEQTFGLLNGVGIGINSSRNVGSGAAVQLYGNNPIPTFLGTTGTTPNGYNSTHPIGQTANMSAALGSVLTNANYGLVTSYNAAKDSFTLTFTSATPYGNFAASYQPAALLSTVSQGTGNFGDNFVVCTTCHNQHNMAVFTGVRGGPALPAGLTQVRTIFFVNGGYNPGAPYDPTHEPSTMRFCQQCHFSFSSEYYGATNVGTAY